MLSDVRTKLKEEFNKNELFFGQQLAGSDDKGYVAPKVNEGSAYASTSDDSNPFALIRGQLPHCFPCRHPFS